MSIEQNVKIGSYNTLVMKYPYNGRDDYTKKAKGGVLYGENLDSRYGHRIANKIVQLNCDCIALQEVNKTSFDKLAEKLWQKEYTGIFSNKNNGEDEGLAIFYKTRRMDMISNHTHYFNDGSGRGIFDVELKLKDNFDISFHLMTSHIDYRTGFMQREFIIFADYVSKIAGPKIICGDFNATPDNSMIQPLWDKQLKDSLYGRHAPTFFDRRIDYILTSPEITTVFNSEVIGDPRKLWSNEEPSDHLPLVTTIRTSHTFVKKTQIIVKYNTGLGNKLFIRGTGPGMSWEKGIELRNINQDTWIFETQSNLPNFEYKILLNDMHWGAGNNGRIECKKTQEITPAFFI
jgi:exonuclease III